MSVHTCFLMYHELELPGRPLCDTEPGYVRYVVRAAEFGTHVTRLRERGMCAFGVTEWLRDPPAGGNAVVITFDDGSETDLLVAAPTLAGAGFGATFYLTAGFLGRRGHLTVEQARELLGHGFEIGSHSMTHAYLPDLADDALQHELVHSKAMLENALGAAVTTFSCPGGRYDRRVLRHAVAAGYRSVTTSRAVRNLPADSPVGLGRVGVMRGANADAVERLVRGQGLAARRLRDAALRLAKSGLGNAAYERARRTALSARRG